MSETPAPTRNQLIDEYAELDRKYRLWKPDLDRYEALKKEIKTWADQLPPEKKPTFESERFQLQLSARENEAHIDMLKTYRRLGFTKFAQIIFGLSVTKLKELLPTAEADGLFHMERTGSRKITAVVSLKKAA